MNEPKTTTPATCALCGNDQRTHDSFSLADDVQAHEFTPATPAEGLKADAPTKVLLLASYCGNDPASDPPCSDWRPCPDCLQICNVAFAKVLKVVGGLDYLGWDKPYDPSLPQSLPIAPSVEQEAECPQCGKYLPGHTPDERETCWSGFARDNPKDAMNDASPYFPGYPPRPSDGGVVEVDGQTKFFESMEDAKEFQEWIMTPDIEDDGV